MARLRSNTTVALASLRAYVSGDDAGLDRKTFLTYVRDRINADIEALATEQVDRTESAGHRASLVELTERGFLR